MKRLFLIVLFLFNNHQSSNAQFLTKKDKRIAAEVVEETTEKLVQWAGSHGRVLQLMLSCVALTYGGKYSHAMLMIHTLKMTSGSLLKDAFRDVVQAYQTMRKEAKKHSPDFQVAKKELEAKTLQAAKIHMRMMEAKTALANGETSQSDFEAIERQAKFEMFSLVQEMDKLRPAVSSLAAIVAAVDADRLRKVGTAVYTALLSAIATSSSRAAATAAIGFNIGRQVATTLRGFVLPIIRRVRKFYDHELDMLPPTTAKTVRAIVTITGTVGGIIIAAKLQGLALTIATCYFAAGALITTSANMLQDTSSNLKNFVQVDSPIFSFLHIAIASIASVAQIRGIIPFPMPLQIFFFPLNILEKYLRALSWRPALRAFI
mmetsp:Transcript_2652/g.3602  ORF Transcript_2652/g.3602 Transcript_2652/m.3602 type:complete len:375 (-) Transcript_2652:30-1154(-)